MKVLVPPNKLREQLVLVRWVGLLFSSAALNSILLLIIAETFKAEAIFLLISFLVSLFIPIFLSIGSTLYLITIGEKRLVKPMDIEFLTIPMIAVVEYIKYYQDPISFLMRVTFLGLYLVFLGLLQNATTVSILGVSGGRSQCITEILVANSSCRDLKQLLSDHSICEALEIFPLKDLGEFCVLHTPEGIGFNCFIFLFSHPQDGFRSVLLFVGYNRTPFEIVRDRLSRHRLIGRKTYLLALLSNKVSFDSSYTLESFVQAFPKFDFASDKAHDYALRPTRVPLLRIKGLPTSAKAILFGIVAPILVCIALYSAGFLSVSDLVITLVPIIVALLFGLLTIIIGRKE